MSYAYDDDNRITAGAGYPRIADWSRFFGSCSALELPSDGAATVTCRVADLRSFVNPYGTFGPVTDSSIYGACPPLRLIVDDSPYGLALNAANFYEPFQPHPTLGANTAATTGRVTITSIGEITSNTVNLNAFEVAIAHIDAAGLMARHAIDVSRPLFKVIATERAIAKIDMENVQLADAAMRDALFVVQRANLRGDPKVMFSSDGILTLQWQRGERGVALIFAGDGMVSLAFRQPGKFYAENGIDVAIAEELPERFNTTLAVILA